MAMLVIRMQRTGRTNAASFRLVVGEKIFSPKSGKHLAQVGSYNPKTKHTIIDEVAVKHWLKMGAQMSGTVNNLFINKGIIQGKKVNVLPKKTVTKVAEPAPQAVAPVEVAEVPEVVASVEEEPKVE